MIDTHECTSKDGGDDCTCDPEPCEECDGSGTGECWGCGGSGFYDPDEGDDAVEDCDECEGTGYVACDMCGGSGDQPRESAVNVS